MDKPQCFFKLARSEAGIEAESGWSEVLSWSVIRREGLWGEGPPPALFLTLRWDSRARLYFMASQRRESYARAALRAQETPRRPPRRIVRLEDAQVSYYAVEPKPGEEPQLSLHIDSPRIEIRSGVAPGGWKTLQ